MALLIIEGFDWASSTDDITKKYQSTGTIGLVTPRDGVGNAISLSGDKAAISKNFTGSTTLIIGFAFKSSFGGDHTLFTLNDNQICFRTSSSRTINAWRPDGGGWSQVFSTIDALEANTWMYLEFKIVLNTGSTGSVEIRKNGALYYQDSTLTTSPVSTPWSNIYFGESPNAVFGNDSNCSIDDIYVCNDSGSMNNDFLGDCKVSTLFPNADGGVNEFTPSTGTDHYAVIDETPLTTTDYLTSTIAGQKEFFNITSLSENPVNVYGIEVNSYWEKTGIDTKTAKVLLKSNTTEVASDEVGLPYGSQLMSTLIVEQDPDTNTNWNQTSINAVQIGAESV